MTLGQKILQLRKEHQMSQEKLAEVLNVSRQALSKWELGTSIPDIDKIILMSDYFKVTTDYLLKKDILENITENITENIRPIETSKEKKLNWKIPFVVSTALIFMGLLVSFFKMVDGALPVYWNFSLSLFGIILQIIGIVTFEVFYFLEKYKFQSQFLFWGINTCLLTLIPSLFMMSLYFRYFVNGYSMIQYFKFVMILYLGINMLIIIPCIWLYRRQLGKI